MPKHYQFFRMLALCLCVVSSFTASGQEPPPSQQKEPAPPHPVLQNAAYKTPQSRGAPAPAVAIDKVIGIPFMHPSAPETREQIIERIKKSILQRLPDLTGYPKDFSALKQHKAV